MKEIFKINDVTSEGFISSDVEETKINGTDGGKIQYLRGPVKLIARARAKAQNDYANEDFPVSACVLDMNRYNIYNIS